MAGGSMGGGSGTSDDPYKVEDAADLNNTRLYIENTYFIQVANIDMNVAPYNTGVGFQPIFIDGCYDGMNFTISNLFMNKTGPAALFNTESAPTGGHIRNIKLVNPSITSTNDVAAGIIISPDRINIEGNEIIGGTIKGQNANGIAYDVTTDTVIRNNKTTNVSVIGTLYANGICYFLGAYTGRLISGNQVVGGTVVSNDKTHGICNKPVDTIVENCDCTAELTGKYVSGITNRGLRSTVRNCTFKGKINANGIDSTDQSHAGGIISSYGVGDTSPIYFNVEKCYADAQIIGNNFSFSAGGFSEDSFGTIFKECYAIGSISGFFHTGGFAYAKSNESEYSDCYARVDMSTGGSVTCGGFFADDRDEVINVVRCYAASKLNPAATHKGGFTANKTYPASVYTGKNYWDTDVSAITTSEGGVNTQGKTTTAMKTQVTFVGFDFTLIWYMGTSGYPELLWSKSASGPPEGLKVVVILNPVVDSNKMELVLATDLANNVYPNHRILVIKSPNTDVNKIDGMKYSDIAASPTTEMRILTIKAPDTEVKLESITASYLTTGA
jgi:hypothetical protein